MTLSLSKTASAAGLSEPVTEIQGFSFSSGMRLDCHSSRSASNLGISVARVLSLVGIEGARLFEYNRERIPFCVLYSFL